MFSFNGDTIGFSSRKLFQPNNEDNENIGELDDENYDTHVNEDLHPRIQASEYFGQGADKRASNQDDEELRLIYELGLHQNLGNNQLDEAKSNSERVVKHQLRDKIKEKVCLVSHLLIYNFL